MSNEHLSLAKANLERVISKPAGTIIKRLKTIARLAKIMTELPKAIAKSLKIAVIMVFTVAILWTSLPIEASPGQSRTLQALGHSTLAA
jgi:hypothetical protein